MEQDVHAFIKQKLALKPNARNRMLRFKEEILLMRENGLSLANIQEYLSTKEVQVTIDAISKFIRKHKEEGADISPTSSQSTPPAKKIKEQQITTATETNNHLTIDWPKKKSIDELV